VDRPAGTTAAPEQALLALRDEQVVGFLDSPVAQARVAPDGRVLAVNDALVRLLGLPRDALVGQDGTALFAEHERDSMRDNLRRLISGEAHYLRRTRQLVHGTEERVLVLTSVAVTDARGGRLLAMSVEDVTDLSRAQAALQSSAERFGAVTRSLPMIVFTFDAQGVCTSSRGAALTRPRSSPPWPGRSPGARATSCASSTAAGGRGTTRRSAPRTAASTAGSASRST
jgi:PAS domain S-box-containing protein